MDMTCPCHKAVLVHRACSVTLKISHRLDNSFIVIEQFSLSWLPTPHQPDIRSRRKFAGIVHVVWR
jgi:hypothetical protein